MSRSRFGTLPEKELEALSDAIKTAPWRQVIESIDLPVIRQKRDWFTNAHRAYPYRILSVPEKGVALDIGAGSGVISGAIAKEFNSVVAFDYSDHLTKFMRKRFSEDHLNNIDIVRGDALNFPFREGSIDLAIVNGVLEWIPDFSQNTHPHSTQIKFLRDVYSILKKNGVLGVGIENRFYLRHFQGLSPHGEPPFVAVLPRFLANRVMKWKEGKLYRNYIYSYWGYKRLLKRAGFKNIRIYIVAPSYYNPHTIISTKGKSSRIFFNQYVREQLSQKKKISLGKRAGYYLLSHLNLFRYLEHSFFISAEKK